MKLTIKRSGRKTDALKADYILLIDGKAFGPYGFNDLKKELFFLAGVPFVQGRDLILEAFTLDSATYETED